MTLSELICANTAGAKLLLLIALPSIPAMDQRSVSLGDAVRPDIRVDVNLVVLDVTVRDTKGRAALGLEATDFTILEDGVRQTLRVFRHEDVPVTVGLVVDHSGSMHDKLADVVTAVRAFVDLSHPDDRMFVVNFNDSPTIGLPAGIEFTNEAVELARAVADTRTEGKTALYDAVLHALRLVLTGIPEKRVLVVISDGADNASVHGLADMLLLARASNAQIFAIGLFDDSNQDRNPRVLRKLAHATGGEAFFPSQPSEVLAISKRIAADIRHQYSLGYVSSNSDKPDGFRSIRVKVGPGRKHLTVRTRAGYQATSNRTAGARP